MIRKPTVLKLKAYKDASSVATGSSFQADVVPAQTYEGEELYRKLAEFLQLSNSSQAEQIVCGIEGFIKSELKKGSRLDFGLVSFFPRLSAALPTRDADPAQEGIFARGAVKARKALSASLAGDVVVENPQAVDALRIVAVMDNEDKDSSYDRFRLRHEVGILNHNFRITIDPSHEDERIWLEKPIKRWHQERVPLAYAQYLSTDQDGWKIRCKFADNAVRPGKYTLCISTRAGKGLDYRLRVVRHLVQVLA